VITARDGKEAWGQIQIHNPDIVILDLTMPGLDGLVYESAAQQSSV